MLTRQELTKSPLFQDIRYEDYQRMLDCFQAVQRSYRPDDVIYDFSGPGSNSVGVVERGGAALIRIGVVLHGEIEAMKLAADGTQFLTARMGPGGVFGRSLAFSTSARDSLEVVCRAACDVVFIDYPHILKRCEHACTHHSLLVQNMLRLISDKAQALSERVDVLSRRSIREKLLCYFRQQTEKSGEDVFTLPFSLSVLADYIATDRSAMMRELRHLKEQGIVCTDGRQIRLLGERPTA